MLEAEKHRVNVVTRNQAKTASDDRIQYTIEEKEGTILNKRNFDLIFHLVPTENDELKTRLMNKFGMTGFSRDFKLVNNCHYICLISN